MAFFTLAFLAALASSLVSAGPFSLDNSTLLANGQQAQILNSEFQYLQVNDSCNTGETACIDNAFAVCIDNAWQTQPCPSMKSCFALPQIRTNGAFVACTSRRNAASIISATGAQGGVTNNSTSTCNITVPFPIIESDSSLEGGDDCGDDGDWSPAPNTTQGTHDGGNPDCSDEGHSSSPGPTTITVTALPATTTTILPYQASSLISSISANGLAFPPAPTPGSGSGSSSNAPPKILLTARPPAPTSFPAPSPSVAITTDGGYSY